MAVTIGNDHTEWFDFDAATSIQFDGNVWGSGDGASTLFKVEGTGSVNAQNKGTGRGGMGHSKSATTISGHMHGWIKTLDIPANSPAGWAMRFSSSTSWNTNYASFNCGGADTNRIIVNGFQPFCADVTATPDRSSSPPALSAVTCMWAESDVTTNSGQKTVFCDRMFFGTVTRIQGGTTGARGTAAEVAAAAAALPVFIPIGGVYYIIDGLEWGITTAADSFFEDEGETLIFESQPSIANDFYNLTFVGNSGQTNICIFGNKTGTGITATGSGGYTFKSGGTQPFSFTATDNNITLGVYGCNFLNSSTSGATWNITNTDSEHLSNLYDKCPQITLGSGVEFRHNTITESSAGATEAAIDMGAVNPGASDNVRDLNISGGTNGMKFTGTGNRTIDLKNIKFSDMTDYLYIDHGVGDTITINNTEGTTVMVAADINNVNGSTLVIVNDPVTLLVNAKDSAGNNLQNARVLIETAATIASGEIFEAAVTSLTQSAGTATCTTTAAHGLSTGDEIVVRGAQPDGYNKAATATVTSTTVFTYPVPSGLSSPATGTPVVSFAAIYGQTDASGNISESRSWGAAQEMKGWVRLNTGSSPFYKQADIAFSVNTTGGNTINAVLQPDE